MPKLSKTDKMHAAFVREYVKDFNGFRAAVAAGFSKKSARSQACRLLTYANVKAGIAEKIEKAEQKQEVTRERIIAEFAKLAFSGGRTSVRKGALDSLARINGMFDDRLRQTVVDDDILAKLAIDMRCTVEVARRRYEEAKAKYEK